MCGPTRALAARPGVDDRGPRLCLTGLQPSAEPPLRALAEFDGNEGSVQFNVEAEAELIEDVVES